MDENKIVAMYQKGMTGREIASHLGVGKTSVLSIVKKAGISRPRVIRDKILQARASVCEKFDASFVKYLDGLIISDGCLLKPRGVSVSTLYTQSSVHKEWLETIAEAMGSKGISCRIFLENRKKPRRPCWVLTTKRYDQFFQMYKRWYCRGIKTVPFDIDINDKFMLKNWLYGDGTLIKKSNLRFCTDSFIDKEIEFLIRKLNELGKFKFKKIKVGKDSKGNQKYRISLCKRDGLFDFYSFIGNCDQSCFKYKWNIK